MDGFILADKKSANDINAQRRNYTRALISEIRLLVRAVSNSPSMRVSNLKFSGKLPSECVGKPASETSFRELHASEIIDEISKVENQIDQQSGIANIGFLQLVRDALVSMTEPATGLTIAYTHLVAGEQRSQPAESGYALAEQAYGLLLGRAKRHRRIAYLLTFIAMLVTFFAAWEATKVSLGKNLLQNLDLLQAQQSVISAEKLKLELVLDKSVRDSEFQITSNDLIPLHAVPLCDRHLLRESMTTIRSDLKGLRFEASPAERELCGRDTILARNLEIVRDNLRKYQTFWPGFVGGIVGNIGGIIGDIVGSLHLGSSVQNETHIKNCSAVPDPSDVKQTNNKSPQCNDVEFSVAPMLQITTNYILPLTFGLIGSLLYVLLDHFTKLRVNTLSPRDFPLMGLRLIIGLVVAACVSLLVSSSANSGAMMAGSTSAAPVAGILVASLTSSASGITFLAGFGAEAVVTLLQSLVARLFAAPK